MSDTIDAAIEAKRLANIPLSGHGETNGKPTPDTDKKAGKDGKGRVKNPILAKLGQPTFVVGDGKQYPRTSGWGKDKKPHPDGGTNETVAFVVFKPFDGLDIAQEGRIYCERFTTVNGEKKRVFSISMPFIKAEKRDSEGRRAVEDLKIIVRDLYRDWAKDATVVKASKESKLADASWSEDDA